MDKVLLMALSLVAAIKKEDRRDRNDSIHVDLAGSRTLTRQDETT